jgi:hypothetical protein
VKQQQPLDRDGSTLIVSDSKGLTYISEDTQKKKKHIFLRRRGFTDNTYFTGVFRLENTRVGKD